MKLITKLFILVDIIIVLCFLLVYGPFDKARVFWITTAMETASHRYFAYIFYSEDTVTKVMESNSLEIITEETDASSITIGEIEEVTNYTSVYERQILERNKDDLYKLIEFKYGEFDCYLVAIYDPKRVEAAYTKNLNSGEILTDIAKRNEALVAINGGGYSWSNYKPVGLIVNNGNLIYSSGYNKFMGASITYDGVLLAGQVSASELKSKNIKEALSFGPALIVNGKSAQIRGTGGSGMNPRTVIAQRKDGIILFLVVNGYGQNLSWKGRGGVYYSDLITILERYGAYNAVNMDGGSSTTLVIDGKLINSPCEPQKEGQDYIKSAWILK